MGPTSRYGCVTNQPFDMEKVSLCKMSVSDLIFPKFFFY